MSTQAFTVNEKEFQKLSKAEQDELRGILAQLVPQLEANPLITYIPHPKQKLFHAARAPILGVKALIAGNRSGKTKSAVVDDLIQALPADFIPPHLLPYKKWEPPFSCRIFTPDLGSTLDEIQDTIKEMCPPAALVGGSWDKAYAKADRILRFTCGSFFDFFSYDQDLDQMASVKRHRIHYDEEPPESVRKASRKRLIDYGGEEVFSFTPELGLSWTHDAIFEKRGDEATFVVRMGMRDNPHIGEAEIQAYVKDLSEEEKKIALFGDYVAIGGTFYPEFGDDHVVDSVGVKDLKGQTIVAGIDPGLNTTAVIYLAFDNDNSVVAFDEIYAHDELPDQVAKRIKERNKFWGVEPRYVIDPTARNRSPNKRENVTSAFQRAGIPVEDGQNDRAAGILEVKARLQNETLTVSRECQDLRWEFPRYRRDPNAPSEFDAIKKDDHGLDALRYGVMARAWSRPEPSEKKKRVRDFWEIPPYQREPADPPPLGVWS